MLTDGGCGVNQIEQGRERKREMSRAMACQPQTHTANIQMKLLFFFVFSFFICTQISRSPSRPLPLDE